MTPRFRRGETMAKKSESTEAITVQVTPREIAKALEGIAEWALSVRKAVLLLDQNVTARTQRQVPTTLSAPPWLDGCPPPDPCDDGEEKPGKNRPGKNTPGKNKRPHRVR
jgi:hypothetical protein